MSQKSLKRIETKKKKAAAFLELVKTDDEYQESRTKIAMKTESNSSDSSSGNKTLNSGSNEAASLSDQMLEEYKKIMRERQKASMQKPKLFITLDELARDDPMQADPSVVKVPPPLFMADVQHLLLFALLGNQASLMPRWCRLLRSGKVTKVVAVVLDSVSSEEINKYPDSLPTLFQAFDLRAEIVSPLQYGSSVREDIMNVPISITQLKKQFSKREQNGKVKNIIKEKRIQTSTARNNWLNPGVKRKREGDDEDTVEVKRFCSGFPEENIDEEVVSTYKMDQYDRRWLMLNSSQMIYEGIPTPANANDPRYNDFVFSKRTYKEVTAQSPMFAVDCEMVQTMASMMDLARVSIVNENLEVVLDTYVKPYAPVTNYVTKFSGITKEILDPVKIRLHDVQKIIQASLPPDAILCGQSICSDLSTMKMFHPYIIDTSVVYNLSGKKGVKTGLKRLTSFFLRKEIQEDAGGHSSVEDASATMELVLLKLRNSMDFGDMTMSMPNILETVNKSACTEDTDTADGNVDAAVQKSDSDRDNEHVKKESDGVDAKSDISSKIVNSTQSCDMDKESNSSSLTRTLETSANANVDIQRRHVFFRREGGKFMENFVKKIETHGKKGYVIDNADSVELYPDSLTVTVAKNDKEAESKSIDCIKADGTFCFTHLYGYKKHLTESLIESEENEEKTKKVLWKLDRRFWKIMMGLPSSSLFAVILPGREHNDTIHSAMTFAKIT